MERRDFVKLCSLTGLTVVAGVALDGDTAEAAPYEGNFFINIAAMGGWDATSIVDPKGDALNDGMNKYPTAAIPKESNGVSWAPMSLSPDVINNQNALDGATAFETFMAANFNRLLVINGIDNQTNSHDVGQRASVTGNGAENSAAFGAVASAALNPSAPMGFISYGGYSGTGGLAPVTRLGSTELIKRLAYPYRRYRSDNEEEQYFSDAQVEMIAKSREARFTGKFAEQRLPRVRTALNTLYLSRLGQNELKKLVAYLPTGELKPGLAGAVELAGAAYKAGLAVACNLDSRAGWDHHGGVDVNVSNSLGTLFDAEAGFPAALDVLAELEIDSKTMVSITSDFGRTPNYNDGDGKDHWPVTSMIITGALDGKKIKSGVKGGSTDGHEPLGVDSVSGTVGGDLTIRPAHIQNAMRRLAGILESDAAKMAPTTEDPSELVNLIELS
jgi:uncharacterized protein (DUF1501 family)